jgi:hypothetical protein
MTDVSEQLRPSTVGKRQMSMLIIYFVLAVAIVVALAAYVHHQASSDTPATTHTASSAGAQQSGATNKPAESSTAGVGSAGSGNASATTVPNTIACKHLTLTIARQLLGTQAEYTTPNEPANLKAADTAVSSCTYSMPNASVQLTVRTAQSSLGASENATAFGSDRPAGSSPVQGYGQSAYWNPDDSTLNILSKNTRYIIIGAQHDQSSAQSVANLLKAGF